MENRRTGYFSDSGDFFTLDNIKVDIPKNREVQLYITNRPISDKPSDIEIAQRVKDFDNMVAALSEIEDEEITDEDIANIPRVSFRGELSV